MKNVEAICCYFALSGLCGWSVKNNLYIKRQDKLIKLSKFTAVPTRLHHKNELKLPTNNFHRHARIMGGRNTTIEAHPYQIALFYHDFHLCGGAILNESKIQLYTMFQT